MSIFVCRKRRNDPDIIDVFLTLNGAKVDTTKTDHKHPGFSKTKRKFRKLYKQALRRLSSKHDNFSYIENPVVKKRLTIYYGFKLHDKKIQESLLDRHSRFTDLWSNAMRT
jgi:hypothetical protein